MHLLVSYWWVILPAAAVAAYYALRFLVERKLESVVGDILHQTQAGFAQGDVDIHSVTATGTTLIEGETATLYDIEATITPSDGQTEWAAADLFLYGIDEDGDHDAMRIGEVRQVQRWDGTAFASIRRTARHAGTQRLKLSVRFAGPAGPTRFNYNFACFGPVFELPQAGVPVSS